MDGGAQGVLRYTAGGEGVHDFAATLSPERAGSLLRAAEVRLRLGP